MVGGYDIIDPEEVIFMFNDQAFHGPVKLTPTFQQLPAIERQNILQTIRIARDKRYKNWVRMTHGTVGKWKWYIEDGVLHIKE